MKRLPLLLVLFLFAMGAVNAAAQDEEEEGRDLLEVSLFGGASIPSGGLSNWNDTLGAKTGLGLGAGIGYFLTERIVIGLNFTYTQYAIDTDTPAKNQHHRFFNPSLYVTRYFFGESDWVPYISGQVGLDNPKFSTWVLDTTGVPPGKFRELSYDPAVSFGASVGLFRYTSDFSGLYLEVNYHYGRTKDVEATFQGNSFVFGETTGMIGVYAGIRAFFGNY